MVLLTATPPIVAAVNRCRALSGRADSASTLDFSSEPSMEDPKPGDPISHEQLIKISKLLKSHDPPPSDSRDEDDRVPPPPSYRLDDLLRGSQVYIPPPKPKPEPSAEYKALMSRLRANQEQLAYNRLLNPPSSSTTSSKNPFSIPAPRHHQPDIGGAYTADDDDDDEVTYADIDRQLTLVLNMLISVIASGIAIWIIARYWDTPRRLFVSMGGAGLVAVAEAAVYAGYLRRVKLAKETERRVVERKVVLDTWVIEGGAKKKARGGAGTGMEVLGGDVKEMRTRKGKKL